jgi:hypothetical protein
MTLTLGAILAALLGPCVERAGGDDAERRAVAYLAAEVPRWSRENHCFSCHNNGDAARALFGAKAAGLMVEDSAIADTIAWLNRPDGWDKNGADGPISDKRLARIEFALALASAVETGASRDRDALRRAAEGVEKDQLADGSWPIEDGGGLGSPATYGRRLASALAVRVLERDDPARHAKAIGRARLWLRSADLSSVLDAAAEVLGQPDAGRDGSRRAVDFLRSSQSRSGGWGPYRDTPTEPFDTALALLALASRRGEPGIIEAIGRGRTALITMQRDDGSWPETTRPAGGESYAQRLSTTGWATLALFATRR